MSELEIQLMINGVRKHIGQYANPEKARILQRFFKTGKGEYAEGDIFLGITVPVQRSIAKKHAGLSLSQIRSLLKSKVHEHRLIALLILIERYRRGDLSTRSNIVDLYLSHTRYINNWDLVDLSAEHILGAYLYDRKRAVLFALARSSSIWDRRIAVLSTFYFIKRGDFSTTLELANILIEDTHDLMHKAVGWMLREVGKRGGVEQEEAFLKRYATRMPRTMLRYAIERFPEDKRKFYLSAKPH